MSFGGAVSAMIKSLKNNARPKIKRFFDRGIPESNINSDHASGQQKNKLNKPVLK